MCVYICESAGEGEEERLREPTVIQHKWYDGSMNQVLQVKHTREQLIPSSERECDSSKLAVEIGLGLKA